MSKVSVIIPTYKGLDFLGEAIRSVLEQTYNDFEVIIVDDASPDKTIELVRQFSDPRVKYIRHEQNRGAVAARYTGVLSSSGELIAFLDQDDLYHPDKLHTHVNFLYANPDVGATYNARFEIKGQSRTIFGIWHPPPTLTLSDFVLGYPVAPSDIVLRREWALHGEIWDDSFAIKKEHMIFNGQEIIFGGRLALAGCLFKNVNRTLNYRRFHLDRVQKHLVERCQSELACQEIIFQDPRCPQDVLVLRNIASSNIYLMWAYVAYLQEEYYLGQQLLEKSVELNPSLLNGEPCELIKSWVAWTVMDNAEYGRGNDAIIQSIFHHLPRSLDMLKNSYDWAIATNYLYKGIHEIIWGKIEVAYIYLSQANQLGAVFDEITIPVFIKELLNYEAEFGFETGRRILNELGACLINISRTSGRKVKGSYWIHKAFDHHHAGQRTKALQSIFRGIINHPRFLYNRGVLSVLVKSISNRSGVKSIGQ